MAELLEAELYELRLERTVPWPSCAVPILEETEKGWQKRPAETRLVPREYARWNGAMPMACDGARILEGSLLRLRLPG